MLRLGITVSVLLLALPPAAARGASQDPFYYQWRDILGRCMDTCNNNYYRCPCIHIRMPR
ncbi:MAG TPA: hypothetical protein VFS74_03915 [Gemmatimonadales bacterium]|jgi:hypothetical protein|nr:hypothetical protein [Gemmatimonadales bacterium]